jgi:4-amino-4-deoxy-L-arabinose transferase-like glycosyltransferase
MPGMVNAASEVGMVRPVEPMLVQRGRQRFRPILWMLLAVFFASSVGLLGLSSRYRSDERYYQDAAVQMVTGGEWLTPRFYDGTLRFRKPVLPYYAVISGFGLLGMNLFAARFFYLIAACGLLLVTYQLNLRLFGRRSVAMLSTAILASNIEFLNTSIRTTPDMLQAVFAAMAILGLVRIALGRMRDSLSLWLFYIGVGLVIGTKGGLGLLLLVFAGLTVVLMGRRLGLRWRDLWHGPAAGVAVVISGWWYVAAYLEHGSVMVEQFFGDQVGNQMAQSWWAIPGNVLVYLGMLVGNFLPWSLLALVLMWDRWDAVKRNYQRHRTAIHLTGLWIAILIGVFMFSSLQRTRYFLPAYPMICGVYAAMIVGLLASARRLVAGDGAGLVRLSLWSNGTVPRSVLVLRMIRIKMIGVGCLGVLQCGLGIAVGSAGIVVAGAALGVAVLVGLRIGGRAGWSTPVMRMVVLALLVLAAFRLTDYGLRRELFRSPADRIVAEVRERAVEGDGAVEVEVGVARRTGLEDRGMVFSFDFASQALLASGGSIRLALFDDAEALRSAMEREPGRFGAVVVPAEATGEFPEWEASSWRSAGVSINALDVPDLWRWVRFCVSGEAATTRWRREYLIRRM